MQAAEPVDPEFVRTLSASIRGMFAGQLAHLTPQKIEAEFRKAVKDPKLTASPGFMDNLMFVVRKKNVTALRGDVEAVLNQTELAPVAEASAMKTLYALGGDRERAVVDERFARKLFADLRGAEIPAGPYLAAADRIGGSRTLAVLENALPEAATRQRQAEQATPDDHVRIGRLDKVRSSLEAASLTLKRKLAILAEPQSRRDADLWKLHVQRAGGLGFWAYRELVRLESPAAADAVRALVPRDPLRTAVLLEDIKAALRPEEKTLLEQNAAEVRDHPEGFRPDWESVLDRD